MKSKLTLKVQKIHPEAKLPERAHSTDAGLDLFTVERVSIASNTIKAIKTGIKIAIPEGYYGQLFSKSGYSLKNTLIIKAGVIDSGYRGEIAVIMQNAGSYPVTVEIGTKLAQLVILPVPTIEIKEDKVEEDITDRGEKGFGSSGIN